MSDLNISVDFIVCLTPGATDSDKDQDVKGGQDMSFYVLAKPEGHASAALVEHLPGQPSLIAEVGDSQIVVQIPGQPDGPKQAARFAWELARAAAEFASRCEELAHPAQLILPTVGSDRL